MTLKASAIGLAFALVAALTSFATAADLDLDAAKSQGLVGERTDGYVGTVSEPASGPVQAVVDAVNAKRRAVYEEIARKNGTTAEAVAMLAGVKLIERAAVGEWVTNADGTWRRK